MRQGAGFLPHSLELLDQNLTLSLLVGGSNADRLQEVMLPVVHHEICSQQDWWGSQVKTAMTCAGEGGVKARCSVRSVTIRGFSSSPLSLSFLSDLAVPSVGTRLPGFAISSPAIALLQILTPLRLPAEHLLNQTTPHSSISPQRSQQRENLQIPRVHPSPLILAGRFTLSSSSMSH